jgi:hypothetical protein
LADELTRSRFTQRDPLGFDAGDKNLYRYVGNSPTVLTDPMGLQESRPTGTVPGVNRTDRGESFRPSEVRPPDYNKIVGGLEHDIPAHLKPKPGAEKPPECQAWSNQALIGRPKPGQMIGIGSISGCTAVLIIPPKDKPNEPVCVIHVGPGYTVGKPLANNLENASPDSVVIVCYKPPSDKYKPAAISLSTLQQLIQLLQSRKKPFKEIYFLPTEGYIYVDCDASVIHAPSKK